MYDMKQVQTYRCLRWNELPSVALYMDQVILVVNEALSIFSEEEGTVVTATMINNYVKLKFIPPPTKKRYEKHQVSRLIVFSLLKRVFSMQDTTALIDAMVMDYGAQAAYDLFCEELEEQLRTAFGGYEREWLNCPCDLGSAKPLMQAALMTIVSREMVLKRLQETTEPSQK